MGNGDDGGSILTPLILLGGLFGLGYVYRKELKLEDFYEDIADRLKHYGLWPFDPIDCTKTCGPNEHLNAATCTCIPNTCTKTCTAPLVLDSNCNCVNNTPQGGTTVFAASADWGSGRNNTWSKVTAIMKKFSPKFVVYPGDFSYTKPADFQKVVNAMKPAVNLGANGNHDGGSYASLFDSYSNNVASVGNCSIMLLNTESGSSAVSFAKANLSKMTNKWKIVAFHKPIYTAKSDHGPESSMKPLIPEFQKAGIHLVLQGHNHIYNRFVKTGGVTYMVVGNGGEGAYSNGSTCSGCPALAKKSSSMGALIVEAGSTSMTCKFINVNNGVEDQWTI